MPGDDGTLVRQAQGGDRRAFEELVERYQGQIYRYVLRSVLDATAAEDLTQDTLVRAYASLKAFRGACSFKTWVYRIARNLCIDYQRSGQGGRRRLMPLTAVVDHPAQGACADPLGRSSQQELAEQVELAIAALPERFRAILVLCDLEGLSYQEAAEVEHCPVGTVKSRLFTARRALRRLLEPYVAQGTALATAATGGGADALWESP